MQRLLAKRTAQIAVTVGTDQALYGVSVPSGSVIHDIKGDMHYLGLIKAQAAAVGAAIEGWILPIHDPDAATSFNTLWDTLVPKDTDTEVIDIDTEASDTAPFYEPGEPDWTQMFDVGLRPRKVYGFYDLMTPADGAITVFQDQETPFGIEWIPGRRKKIRVKKNMRVSQHSVLVFGFGQPAYDDTTTQFETALAEDEWNRAKYLKDVIHEAMRHLFGLTEAGAETPWEEATALLKKLLEPDVQEATAGYFASTTFTVAGRLKVDMSVEGELEGFMLSSGRG